MTIERDPEIQFHAEGTLTAVTRWVSSHDEGLSELLKNARRAYLVDRADVAEEHQVAVLLLRDEDQTGPARVGLLDVGGATLEDVTAWSTWQDPSASSRGSGLEEEETQGNGGKAYLYRMFRGPAHFIGVRDGKRNHKGFEGQDPVERGTPGFVPSAAEGRELVIQDWKLELDRALAGYSITFDDLPPEMRDALAAREAFTLVEGVEPADVYRGRIDTEDMIQRVLRHDQSTLAVQQLRLYATHNARLLNDGRPLELERIVPYPELEGPFVEPIPEQLPSDDGQIVSTTDSGTKPPGRLVLYTSRENMPQQYRRLKPRWKVSYRTMHQMIGSKPISDLAPNTPGAVFIYAEIELPALEPAYVEHGRKRPKDGPLVEAVDLFASEKLRELARRITELRRRDLDEEALDRVHEENRRLDEFKNRFLPSADGGDGGSGDEPGTGEPGSGGGQPPGPFGTTPEFIELSFPTGGLRIARGLRLHLNTLLKATVRDSQGRPVPDAELEWTSSDPSVGSIDGDALAARDKGKCDVQAMVSGTHVASEHVPLTIWVVDHVLLTPRQIELAVGARRQITAEVTNDEGERATDVILEWRHDADDELLVRIGPTGWLTGNRTGRTAVTAGAVDPILGPLWARIAVDVTVVPSEDEPARGGGFPRLLLTDRDIDPDTNTIRAGDPDKPALWQEVSDYLHNIWWLNLQSAEAAFAFSRHDQNPEVWRVFHVGKLMEMVTHVFMLEEFTTRGDDERPEYWANHRTALERNGTRIIQQMWQGLERYVATGGELGPE